jgi:hypothetical protein
MNIQNKNKNKRRKYILAALLMAGLLIVAAAALYAKYSNLSPEFNGSPTTSETRDENTVNTAPPNSAQEDSAQQIKEDAVKNDTDTAEPGLVTDIEISPPIVDSDSVRLQTKINRLSNTGKCILKITNGSTVKTYTSTTQAQASYSTCKGFTIAKSDLGPGTWVIDLTYSDGDYTGHDETSVAI